MNTLKPVGELMQRRMDRKDFLKHVGIGFAALTGITAVIKTLKPDQQNTGYGASAYGGAKR